MNSAEPTFPTRVGHGFRRASAAANFRAWSLALYRVDA